MTIGSDGAKIQAYKVYAIRYATDATWRRGRGFVHDPSPDRLMRMDFFCWLAVNDHDSIVIDTGCTRTRAEEMGHEFVCDPLDALRKLGVEPQDVRSLIVTHCHYDHIGNLAAFPKAAIHMQRRELEFVNGPHMRHACFRRGYCTDDLAALLPLLHAGRIVLHEGDVTLAPGLSLHLVGGHTMGLQCVRILTDSGWIVLASDALHYYHEIEASVPWSSNVFHVGEMMDAHSKMKDLAKTAAHIVPGHDPLVMERFAPSNRADTCVELHAGPACCRV